ncbi:MAG: ATP synthase F0 subunit C [Fimbriimonadales bacterium]|nr:ATP synthase F0 subunit C [Fimbriimonadales bacterium]
MDVIGLGIAALGVAIGLGLIGYSALQAMSRQPEAIGKLQVAMLIALAFVELVFLLTVFVGANNLKTVLPAGAPVSSTATGQ